MLWPYNKSFIDPANLFGQAGWMLASFFFFFFLRFLDLDFVSVHKNAKNNETNIQ